MVSSSFITIFFDILLQDIKEYISDGIIVIRKRIRKLTGVEIKNPIMLIVVALLISASLSIFLIIFLTYFGFDFDIFFRRIQTMDWIDYRGG